MKNTGRTGRPGNRENTAAIHIRTAHPEKLSLSDGPKVVPSAAAVLGGNVPKRPKKGKGTY